MLLLRGIYNVDSRKKFESAKKILPSIGLRAEIKELYEKHVNELYSRKM